MRLVTLKKEHIILGVVIAALLLYLVLRNPDRINYQLPDLPFIGVGTISRLEIAKAGQMIGLEKKGDQWLIQPQGFSADPDRVKAIMDIVTGLTLTALVSESGHYFPYGLDPENAIHIKAYDPQRLLREFSVGNDASTYSHTFVKLATDPRVFHAKKAFRSDFDQKTDGLRDKTVLRVDKAQIMAIEIATAGARVLFTKNIKPVEAGAGAMQPQSQATPPAGEESWLMADGKPGNGAELNGILDSASQLACEGFIEGKTKADFREPLYTVTLKGAKDFQLAIFPKTEKEISYPAVSSENPYPFLLSAYKAEGVMKKLAVLKNEKNPAN